SGHLRRAWRRSGIRQVLPQNRAQLCVLLALPVVDGKAGGCASGTPGEATGTRPAHHQLADPNRLTGKGAALRLRPCCVWANSGGVPEAHCTTRRNKVGFYIVSRNGRFGSASISSSVTTKK